MTFFDYAHTHPVITAMAMGAAFIFLSAALGDVLCAWGETKK